VDRAAFRAKTLGAGKKFRKETLELEINDEKLLVEVRQPSVEDRSAILLASGGVDENGQPRNIAGLQIAAVIACTFLPDGAKVFEEADREVLMGMPAGGWLDELATTAIGLMNVDQGAAAKK
jgi:hypothetical protein